MNKKYIVIVNKSVIYWDYSSSIPICLLDFYNYIKFFNTEFGASLYLNKNVSYDRIFKLGLTSTSYLRKGQVYY